MDNKPGHADLSEKIKVLEKQIETMQANHNALQSEKTLDTPEAGYCRQGGAGKSMSKS